MRKNLSVALSALSIGLLLVSGCAKDQVKPGEVVPPTAAKTDNTAQSQKANAQQQSQQQSSPDQLATQQQSTSQQQAATAQRQAAEKAAAERAAAEKTAADKAAAEKAVAERAAAEKAAAQKAAQQSADSVLSSIKMVNFEFDSYALSQQARDILYGNAEYLLKSYKGKVKLEGHCDERGSDEYNLALGENRAKAVQNYLLTLGVPASQMSIISYGKERPLDTASTEEAWAKNRRVEFAIVK